MAYDVLCWILDLGHLPICIMNCISIECELLVTIYGIDLKSSNTLNGKTSLIKTEEVMLSADFLTLKF